MCHNQTNSISIAILSIPLLLFSSTVLNITFLIRHWTRFDDLDQQILRSIAILLMTFGFMMNAFVAFIFTEQTIGRPSIRLLYIFISSVGLGQLYLYFYQKSDKLGLRLKSIEYKLAVVNFSVDLSSFIFNYSMLYIIYLPFYKQLFPSLSLTNIDTLTVTISPIAVFISAFMVFMKGISLMCFEEQDDNWFKRLFFIGVCCCDWLQCAKSREYYLEDGEESEFTDY